ncbi:MAG TPA: 5'-nucleotidase C-terminal domain-containing protein [Candidatus Eremiobacteraeota bacterium]|nr:MAG: hypothetical protein BWY64_02853 [bacterium ADurb.Bin363]HPZ09036.1 5'-nucleotidase C-terminal domain-containing protein [Candidatus Eremiobacteraeota bacterium]
MSDKKTVDITSTSLQWKIIHETSVLPDFTRWNSSQEGGQNFVLFTRGGEKILLLCNETVLDRSFPDLTKGYIRTSEDYHIDEKIFDEIFEYMLDEGWELEGCLNLTFEGYEKKARHISSILIDKLDSLLGALDPVTGELVETVFITSKLKSTFSLYKASSVIGNYLADMLRELTISTISFLPNGIITGDLNACDSDGKVLERGLLTRRNIYRSLGGFPCEYFVIKKLSLEQIKAVLETSIICLFIDHKEKEINGFSDKGFWSLQISGITADFDLKSPYGEKIKNLSILIDDFEYNQLIKNGVYLDDESKYKKFKVVYPSFLSRGINLDLTVKDREGNILEDLNGFKQSYNHFMFTSEDREVEKYELANPYINDLTIKQINMAQTIISELNREGENLVLNEVVMKINPESLQFALMDYLVENSPIDVEGELRKELLVNRIKPVGGEEYMSEK